MKAKLKKNLRKGLIDRLKIVEYRLKSYGIATSLKLELRAIIEALEQIEVS